jgi:hypothetical protein
LRFIIVHCNIVALHKTENPMTPDTRREPPKSATSRNSFYSALAEAARKRTENAAARVAAGKKPLQTASRLGLGLTALTHRTADKVLQQQQRLIDNQIDALAERLRSAAAAGGLRDLVGTQLRLVPRHASQFARDAGATLSIVFGAGSDAGKLVRSTVADTRGRSADDKPAAGARNTRTVGSRRPTPKSAKTTGARPGTTRKRKPAKTVQ